MYVHFCKCGAKVLVEFKWNGLAYIPTFLDINQNKPITHCPQCGEWLKYEDRLERPIEDDQ